MSQHRFPARFRRSLLVVVLLSSVAAPLAAGSLHKAAAAPVYDPPGALDLWHLDTDTARYTQGVNGQIDVQLYNSPVGIPNETGWHLRDTRIGPPGPDGRFSPLGLPFQLSVAPTNSDARLISLTNEDGVGLNIGLASINGTAPSGVAAQVANDATVYHAPVAAAPSDVVVRSTVSGVDIRLLVHSPAEGTSFAFALTPDSGAQISQDASGVIRATRPVTDYSDTGGAYVITQTEYIVQTPIATDSSADVVAPVTTGPVAMTLATGANGQQDVSVQIDSAWLHDPHRSFPVQVDLPIVTAYSAVHTGLFGTTSSCAPDTRAPQTDVIVGSTTSCTYHGQLYFDTSLIRPTAAIQSATLHLFTSNQTGPTSVQVYQNAGPSTATPIQPESWLQPSWRTEPAPVSASAGLGQSASNGHDQSWDVTNIVRQWVGDARMNGGLTLMGSSAPVQFASSLGAEAHDAATTPYLAITYQPQPVVPSSQLQPMASSSQLQPITYSSFYDQKPYIYGVSGTFAANCSSIVCNFGTFSINQVYNLSGQYIRVGAQLSCNSSAVPTAAPYNNGSMSSILSNAFNKGLIPIVNFLPPGSSQCVLSPSSWKSEVKNFINYYSSLKTAAVDFEIGNEENYNTSQYPDYVNEFGYAAQGIGYTMSSTNSHYRILTGGMLRPSANTTSTCSSPGGNVNINETNNAINKAKSLGVGDQYLGVGIHPYSYNTNESGYWKNYYTEYGTSSGHNGYYGVCGDLRTTISLWSNTYFPNKPVFFTEDNWTTHPTTVQNCSNTSGCEGTYQVDLFTWLFDHGWTYSSSPIRLQFFRGADADLPLGLYTGTGGNKSVIVNYCPKVSSIQGTTSYIASNYRELIKYACY